MTFTDIFKALDKHAFANEAEKEKTILGIAERFAGSGVTEEDILTLAAPHLASNPAKKEPLGGTPLGGTPQKEQSSSLAEVRQKLTDLQQGKAPIPWNSLAGQQYEKKLKNYEEYLANENGKRINDQ